MRRESIDKLRDPLATLARHTSVKGVGSKELFEWWTLGWNVVEFDAYSEMTAEDRETFGTLVRAALTDDAKRKDLLTKADQAEDVRWLYAFAMLIYNETATELQSRGEMLQRPDEREFRGPRH